MICLRSACETKVLKEEMVRNALLTAFCGPLLSISKVVYPAVPGAPQYYFPEHSQLHSYCSPRLLQHALCYD